MVDRGGQDRVGSPHEATTQVPDDAPHDAPLDVTDPGVDPGVDPGLDPGVDPGVDQLGWDATALVVAHVVLALGIGAAVGAVGGALPPRSARPGGRLGALTAAHPVSAPRRPASSTLWQVHDLRPDET